jgi:hypothetical protein
MRKILYNKNTLIRLIFLIIIMISIITGSCSRRKPRLDKKNLIPEKELVLILTDIHLADGLLTIPKINSMYRTLDSISVYYQIIEQHGYTKQLMDKTMHYYFINRPKELIKIYDQVLGTLSKMESITEKESKIELSHVTNLWKGKDFYSFPSPPGNDSTRFDVTLYRGGFYTLAFSVTLFPDDQSLNPKATIYTCSPDSLQTGKRHYFKIADYIKDGYPHGYYLTLTVPDGKVLNLGGWLYDSDNCYQSPERHAIIGNIMLTYTSSQL